MNGGKTPPNAARRCSAARRETELHEGTLPHGGRREARPYGVLVVVLGGGDDVGFFVVDTSVAPELEPAAVVVGS